MSRLITRRVAALVLAFGLSLVAVSGCGGDDPGRGSRVNAPAVEPESPADPVTEPEQPDPVTEPEQPDPATEPTTNPCAFPGDPLCSDTPLKVPPPDFSGW
jgi:hypothetical protein